MKTIPSLYTGANNPKESRDCTVRALANALEIDYGAAHRTLRKHGRKSNCGANSSVWHEAYTESGFELQGIYGTTIRTQYLSRKLEITPNKGISLGKLLPSLKTGRFIVVITGHALAVINGSIIDRGVNRAGSSVVAVYRKV